MIEDDDLELAQDFIADLTRRTRVRAVAFSSEGKVNDGVRDNRPSEAEAGRAADANFAGAANSQHAGFRRLLF